jgi:hypothetical protein
MCISKFQSSQNEYDTNRESNHEQWHHFEPTRIARSKQGRARSGRCNQAGFTTLGATFLFLIFLLSIGSFLILHQITNKIKKQIELDQLTGTIAIQLRASIITIEESEKRLVVAKATMLSGCLYLPSCPAFTRAYELHKKIEEGVQNVAKQNWNAQKIKWFTYLPFLSKKNSIPSLSDLKRDNQLIIKIKSGSLISASKLWKTNSSSNGWKIAWVE